MVSYDRLWKLLVDKKLNRTELAASCKISRNTIARMGRNEPVNIDVLERICIELDCELDDVVEIKL